LRAEVIAIGSELLVPPRGETNGAYVTSRLREVGVPVAARVTVADDFDLLRSVMAHALARSEIVIATGGLGPTEDDLTREAAAAALGRPLHRDPAILERLRERFARYKRAMAPVNEKQADVIEGGVVLPNPRGTAPGQYVEAQGRLLVLLPGPPSEMEPMLDAQVLPVIRARSGGRVLRRLSLRMASVSESDIEQTVAPLYKTYRNPVTTILSAPGQVELHLNAEAPTQAAADALNEDLAAGIRRLLPGRIYSEDGRELNEVVAALLLERGLSLALAESCTGGLVSARLTEVPGSSRFLDRGFVTYSNASKSELLGVDPELLASFGAVSEEVARAMARGARERSRSDLGLAITGIAGPDGGSEEKPVGTVCIALAGIAPERAKRVVFIGDRGRVRFQAGQLALEMLRRSLLGIEG
jgi:competence/damage-inducible protein CinA-like protein